MAKTQKAAEKPAATQDVDDFLNDNPEAEMVEEIDTTNLDLTQIPPPEPVQNPIVSSTGKDTVGAPKVTGSLKKIDFTRFGSNKRPLTTDLSDQMLPPVTKKRTAIYQLIGINEGKTTDKRIEASESAAAQIVDVSDIELHPSYTIFDQFEPDFGRRQKVVTYYDGVQRVNYKDPVTGETKPDIRQKVGTPKFVRGQAMVDINRNYHQYLWWELHPGNANNKFRDRSKAPWFERIDIKHYNPHTQQMRMELRLDAMNYVRKLTPNEAMDLAAALSIPAFRSQPSEVKTALYQKAELDPELVLFKAPNKAVSTTITVMRCLDFGIIDYDAMRKQFFFGQNITEPFFQVPLDEAPVQSLAGHLVKSDEGEEILKKMEEYLLYWM